MNIGPDCPYCDRENDYTDCEYYETCTRYEHECEHCSKKYLVEVEFDPIYMSRKADCLNGEAEHAYCDPMKVPSYTKAYDTVRICKVCGHNDIT